MSLFTALFPHADAVEHLTEAVAPMRAAWPSLRWVRPERWHMTAVFLGDVDDGAVPGLVAATGRAVAGLPAPALRLAGAGEFPGRGRPLRVLWVGVAGEVAPVVAACEQAARDCGVRLEQREHVPHLTLARADRPRRRAAPAAGPSARDSPGRDGPVGALSSYAGPARTVPAVHVLRSRPGSPGPYETVATFPLAGERSRGATPGA
jgi:2'-5' RNA ligase